LSQSPIDFVNLLVQPPGDLLFFLGVILVTQAGLFMAVDRRLRVPKDQAARRYLWAELGVTVVWVMLMVAALAALLVGQDASALLPPLERAAQVISVILLSWALLAADAEKWGRRPNIVALGLLAGVLMVYLITGTQWAGQSGTGDFNLSVYALVWAVIPVLVTASAIIFTGLHFRSVLDAPLKLVFFAVLLVGYVSTILQIGQGRLIGDYAGVSRLAFLAALMIVPVVIYRMMVARMLWQDGLKVASSASLAPVAENGLSGAGVERESGQLLKALGVILEKPSPADTPKQVVRATIDTLKVDLVVLLTQQGPNYADVVYAFDNVMDREILAMALNLDDQPTLVNAIERGQQRPLYPDRNAEELQDLYTRLDINAIGPTYFQPLLQGNRLVGVLVVGMPYTKRELSDSLQERLKGLAMIASGLLALSHEVHEVQVKGAIQPIEAVLHTPIEEDHEAASVVARQEMQASLELAREQVSALSQQVTRLKVEMDYERNRLTSLLGDTEAGMSISQRILALGEDQQRLQSERDALLARLQEAETALAGATGSSNEDVFNTMIGVLTREKDDLLAQRDTLQAQLLAVRQGGAVPEADSVQDMIAVMGDEKSRLAQERDQLAEKLQAIETQLSSLGIENGPAGFLKLVGQLHEQRSALQARYEKVSHEREALLRERQALNEKIRSEQDRDKQIQDLQSELAYVAADREAAIKQRDKLRAEREDLIALHEQVKQAHTRMMTEIQGYRQEVAGAHEEQARLRQEKQAIANERSDLMKRIDRLEAERQSLMAERDQLLARIEGDRDRLKQLGVDGVGALTKIIQDLTEERNQLEHQLHETQNQLAAMEDRAEMLQVQVNAHQSLGIHAPGDAELLLGMVQEFRTPMTSIVGYTDLLLAESAGILGEMQRKFLQRVLSNVNRLRGMLDDLIRITTLDTGQFRLRLDRVDVIGLIEDAITQSGSQLREKGLTVSLNLPEDVPLLTVDEDAVNQVIGQLLTNAYLASPPNSEIYITAQQRPVSLPHNGSEALTHSLLVSIEDRGGGIAPDDLGEVFSRKYKAENPLIQGLGDTGIGLAIAKALVEAHGGRLWLEVRPQLGNIFHFVLPLESHTMLEASR
jgi:signal transduction histidine kinase